MVYGSIRSRINVSVVDETDLHAQHHFQTNSSKVADVLMMNERIVMLGDSLDPFYKLSWLECDPEAHEVEIYHSHDVPSDLHMWNGKAYCIDKQGCSYQLREYSIRKRPKTHRKSRRMGENDIAYSAISKKN